MLSTGGGGLEGREPSIPIVPLGFALQPVSYSLQSRQRPQPNSGNLDGYTLCQNW